jgi:hypothetical protein
MFPAGTELAERSADTSSIMGVIITYHFVSCTVSDTSEVEPPQLIVGALFAQIAHVSPETRGWVSQDRIGDRLIDAFWWVYSSFTRLVCSSSTARAGDQDQVPVGPHLPFARCNP